MMADLSSRETLRVLQRWTESAEFYPPLYRQRSWGLLLPEGMVHELLKLWIIMHDVLVKVFKAKNLAPTSMSARGGPLLRSVQTEAWMKKWSLPEAPVLGLIKSFFGKCLVSGVCQSPAVMGCLCFLSILTHLRVKGSRRRQEWLYVDVLSWSGVFMPALKLSLLGCSNSVAGECSQFLKRNSKESLLSVSCEALSAVKGCTAITAGSWANVEEGTTLAAEGSSTRPLIRSTVGGKYYGQLGKYEYPVVKGIWWNPRGERVSLCENASSRFSWLCHLEVIVLSV